VEQNAKLALNVAPHAYVMENGRIVMDDTAEKLRQNPDIKDFYLGLKDVGEERVFGMLNTISEENDGLLKPLNSRRGFMTHRNAITCKFVLILVALGFLTGCAGIEAKPTDQTFKAPTVTLDSMEVVHYWGWWYYAKAVAPTKGTAGNNGAPLDLAFIFNIEKSQPLSGHAGKPEIYRCL